jgi:hypothetical protein
MHDINAGFYKYSDRGRWRRWEHIVLHRRQ